MVHCYCFLILGIRMDTVRLPVGTEQGVSAYAMGCNYVAVFLFSE